MLTDGPIPRFVHGLIEYVAALAFLLAPSLLGFDEFSATLASIVVGLAIAALAATTDGPTSLVDRIPIGVHVVLDYLLAVLLVAAPLVLGFSEDTVATAFFITLGVLHLLVTIGTRFRVGVPGSHRHRRRSH